MSIRFNSFLIIILVASILSVSCTGKKNYQPSELVKLNTTQIITIAKNQQFPSQEKITFKDSLGNILTPEEVNALDQSKFGADYYADSLGNIKELVFRRLTKEDEKLRQELKALSENPSNIETIPIDCSMVKDILEEVYKKDQENRLNGTVSDLETDRKNQQLVVSIIEQCGFPTLECEGARSIKAVFLVIQHADRFLRKKYFPHFKRMAENGDFSKSTLALMEDRLLMDEGKKQIYGTQVHQVDGSSEWKVYPIEDSAHVDEKRAEIGLEPLADYLARFGINYESTN
jgi:hypothetical protein